MFPFQRVSHTVLPTRVSVECFKGQTLMVSFVLGGEGNGSDYRADKWMETSSFVSCHHVYEICVIWNSRMSHCTRELFPSNLHVPPWSALPPNLSTAILHVVTMYMYTIHTFNKYCTTQQYLYSVHAHVIIGFKCMVFLSTGSIWVTWRVVKECPTAIELSIVHCMC